jgi:hypothetical protein
MEKPMQMADAVDDLMVKMAGYIVDFLGAADPAVAERRLLEVWRSNPEIVASFRKAAAEGLEVPSIH